MGPPMAAAKNGAAYIIASAVARRHFGNGEISNEILDVTKYYSRPSDLNLQIR
jgi:hypothetical protein